MNGTRGCSYTLRVRGREAKNEQVKMIETLLRNQWSIKEGILKDYALVN